jgi:hypothetical protein
MISIVGFGRPKFAKSSTSETQQPTTQNKKCEACGQEIK